MLKVSKEVFGSMANNAYLITDTKTNKSALVDCPEYSDKMKSFIEGVDLCYILLTHGHYDHILGVKGVRTQTGAKVVITEEDEPMLKSSRQSLAVFCGAFQEKVEADLIISDGDTIMLGESEIKAMATPGHTKGGVCYICENNIFSGDTLFCMSCGRVDFPGGSASELEDSLKKLANLSGDYNVYPGHESVTTLDFERKNNPYLKSL